MTHLFSWCHCLTEWSCSAQIGMLYFFSNKSTAETKKETVAGLNVKNNKAGIRPRVKFACGHVRTLSNMASPLDFGGRNVFGQHGVQTKQLCFIHFFLFRKCQTQNLEGVQSGSRAFIFTI